MDITNKFKQRLKNGEIQYGIWNGLVDTVVAEILAGSGFDFVLVDSEHAPFDIRTIQAQLQAIKSYNVPVVMRPPVGEKNLIKRLMDIGVQSLLIPSVESAEEAAQCAAFMRYPPEGVRGVGLALSRAAQWGRAEDYFEKANDEMCLIVQVETVRGVENLEAILQVEHVDAVFMGPSDLAASMGLLGQPVHRDVVATVHECLGKIAGSDKRAGVLASSKELTLEYIKRGAKIIGAGLDTLLLAKAAQKLANDYKHKF